MGGHTHADADEQDEKNRHDEQQYPGHILDYVLQVPSHVGFFFGDGQNTLVCRKKSYQKENNRRYGVKHYCHVPAFCVVTLPKIFRQRQGRERNNNPGCKRAYKFGSCGIRPFDGVPTDDAQQGRIRNIDRRVQKHKRDKRDVGINQFSRIRKTRRRKRENRGNRQRNGSP